MRAFTFGPPSFETPIARIEPDADVLFGLLLYVAASDPRGVSRDELAALVWPTAALEQGRHSLRQALYRLRQLGVPIHLRAGQVAIDENDTEIDLRELMHGPIDRGELVRIGIQQFLPGYRPQLGDAFRSWVEDLRERAASVRRRALAAGIVDARARARFSEIHPLARSLLALDPLNETATLALAEALVMDGSKVDAVQLLERYEAEVGEVSEALRIPARTLRRRVSEGMDDTLMPLRFEVPFVGRIPEFGALRDAWAGARRGAGQCVMVTGEPGIGKTRTSTELARLAVLDGGLVVTYTCSAGDTMAPLSSLLGLTAALLGQPGALGCGQEHLSYLRRLIHPDPQQPLASGLTADLAYAQLVYSLAELVAAISEEAPLVIFIDDAHKLHQTSWRIFTDVTHRTPDSAVLLLLAARQVPEFYPTLGITSSDGRMRHVRLQPFGWADSHEFLGRWSERNQVSLDDSVVERFSQTAAGNPFYLGELAAHRGRGGPDDVPPATIRGLIELQFAGLREHAQRVLLVVSLLQAHATLERVTQVLELTPMELLSALEELELAGLVQARSSTLRLRHDTIVDVTLQVCTRVVVTYLSMRVACLLEGQAEGDNEVRVLSTVSSLWETCGDTERMALSCIRLGSAQLGLGLSTEAEVAFCRALRVTANASTVDCARLGLSRSLRFSASWHRLAALECDVLPTGRADHAERAVNSEEARYWAHGLLPNTELLAGILRDRTTGPSVRAIALQLSAMVWDNTDRSWPLPCTTSELSALPATLTASERHSAQIVVYTALREARQAIQVVEEAHPRALFEHPAQRLRALRFAGYALTTFGKPQEALGYFRDAFQTACEVRAAAHEALGASMVARIASHLQDQSELYSVIQWAAERATACTCDPLAVRYRLSALAAAAWALEDEELLQRSAEQFLGLPQAVRDVEKTTSYAMHSFYADANLVALPDGMLEWVDRGGDGLFARGSADHVAVALARALWRTGAGSAATTAWHRYTNSQRVEQTAISPALLSKLPPVIAATADAAPK